MSEKSDRVVPTTTRRESKMLNMDETPNPREAYDDFTAEDAMEMFGEV